MFLKLITISLKHEQDYKSSLLQLLSLVNTLALFVAAVVLSLVALLIGQPLIYLPAATNLICSGMAFSGYWFTRHTFTRKFYTLGSRLLVAAWLLAVGVGYAVLGTALPLPLVLIIPIAMNAALGGSLETGLIAGLCLLLSGAMYLYYDFFHLSEPLLRLSPEVVAILDLALVLICIPVIVALFVVPNNRLLYIIRAQNKQLQQELYEKQQAEETQRRLAEENARLYQESQQALQVQQELDQLKDYFLSVVSHDLRTPLTSIRGYTQILRETMLPKNENGSSSVATRATDPAKSLRITDAMLRQTYRMNDLITRLLEFSRLQIGQLDLRCTPNQNLLELVQQVVEDQRVTTTQHRLVLQLPDPPAPILVTYDAPRLEQVLNNLISNAIKYSPPETTITVGLDSSKSAEVVVWVKDEGYGISLEDQPQLFERFYRGQAAQAQNARGLGLGLYISREIITQHGGRLWLESEPGKGSTFYFSLPTSPQD